MNKCPSVARVQGSILRNSLNSNTRRLQHEYPLEPSWKIGNPLWYEQDSVERSRVAQLEDCTNPHPGRLHVAPSVIEFTLAGSEGSMYGFGSCADVVGAGSWAVVATAAGVAEPKTSFPSACLLPTSRSLLEEDSLVVAACFGL